MLEGKSSHSRNLCAHEIADVLTLLPLAWSNHHGPFCKELEQLRVHVNSHAEERSLSDKLFHTEGEEEAGGKWQMLSRQQSHSGHLCITRKRQKLQAEIKLGTMEPLEGEKRASAHCLGQLLAQSLVRTFEPLS